MQKDDLNRPVERYMSSNHYPEGWGESEKRALCVLAKVSSRSLKAHVSKHVFFRGYSTKDRGQARKALMRIVQLGLAMKHPTRGEMTYQLTKRGLTLVSNLELNLQIQSCEIVEAHNARY
jgi:hypothetical protein